MDGFKHRAGEKIDALHDAAVVAASNSKVRLESVYQQTTDAILKIRELFNEIWHHELVTEGRARAVDWGREAAKRIREGALPLSPAVLYQELVTLLKDRVWRRSMIIFACGAVLGGSTGLVIGLRTATRGPSGPHARALQTQADQSVILVEDAVSHGAGPSEVLVRVQAFSVSTIDRSVLRGRASALRSLVTRSHVTVGRGFAGVVLDVGQGVTEFEMGDEVWGCLSEWSGGAATELLAVRSSRISKRPRTLGADSAASLPWAGSLALIALDALRITPDSCKGKRVLVAGAASGEGCALIQLLGCWGARTSAAAPRHSRDTLRNLGAQDFMELEGQNEHSAASWLVVEQHASRTGPWDACIACAGAPPNRPPYNTLLKATAPRRAALELRPGALVTDRLPSPLWAVFTVSFYSLRVLRWLTGHGWHCDWFESRHRLSDGLDTLRHLVEGGQLSPVLDKVYFPQDFEAALAHACSDKAVGTTVIRFP
ncbi:reticulon-4-interacting protein 1, mitochondrial-like [Pieris napi]|uniref:reticulon-4-interacting protein 1, mitochondrial-like n=1 Tax=Pieris napi TaxID=78633 RepID=UPI001FB8F45B|nr:reticulon-4-interacting protein 1, mitochondrial-like [Pieris napi]